MSKQHQAAASTAASVAPSATKPTTPSPKGQPQSDEAIRMCAYRKWEAAGRPSGDGVRFWLDAEKELAQAK